jgi:hypothetical protein
MRPRLHGMSPLPSPVVHHQIECIHQAEIEVWPATAEAYFLDEQFADAASAQIRFDATVINTPSRAIRWEVQSLSGGPGRGTIDGSGLYTAPNKGDLASGTTEIVVATAMDDPLRKAFARVTLLGRGPELAPDPRLELFPRHCQLYTRRDPYDDYIDGSNKRQLFRVEILKAKALESDLVWTVRVGATSSTVATGVSHFLYVAPLYITDPPLVTITVALQSRPEIYDTATVLLLMYGWPQPPYWLPPVPPPV